MNAVFRIMESKGIFHSANFQPCGISGNITSVGIVRITLFRHNADSGMSSEIGFFKAAFCPVVQIFHDHKRRRVIDVFEVMRNFDSQNKIAFDFRIIIGCIVSDSGVMPSSETVPLLQKKSVPAGAKMTSLPSSSLLIRFHLTRKNPSSYLLSKKCV